MKLPIKHIAILVIASLIAIFAYQTYWLVSMYHTMKTDMEHSITEAMRTCDYNEMMLRIECMRRDDKDHGEISVSAGYNDEGGTLVRSSTTIHKEKVHKGMDVQQDTILRTEKKLDTPMASSTAFLAFIQVSLLMRLAMRAWLRPLFAA